MAIKLGEAVLFLNADPTELNRKIGETNRQFKRDFGNIADLSKKVGLGFTIMGGAITAGMAQGVKSAVEFESAFAGVEKTFSQADGSSQLFNVELASLRTRFEEMSTTIPVTFTELARIGEIAGQLGVKGADDIALFTEVIAKMDVTTDLAAEEAAVSFAQIANVMQEPISNADRMGSTIVALGNTFATNEPAIAAFAQRIAGVGNLVGLTTPDIMSIGAAFSSVGVEAESGGTSVQKTFNTINEAVATGNDSLGVFASTAGLSVEEFSQLFRVNAQEAFTLFVEGLGKQGTEAVLTLDQVGLSGERTVTSLLSMSGAGDLLRNSLVLGTQAWQDNTALNEEAAKRFATTESQMILLKNTLDLLASKVGDALLPVLSELARAAIPIIQGIGDWMKENKMLTDILIKVAAAGGALMLVLGPYLIMLPGLIAAFGLIATAIGLLMGPVGAMIVGIVAVTAVYGAVVAVLVFVGKKIVEHFDTIKAPFLAMWEFFKAGFGVMADVFRGFGDAAQAVWDLIVSGLKSAANFIGGIIKGVIDTVRNAVSAVGDFLGFASGGLIPFANGGIIPAMANGGVIDQIQKLGVGGVAKHRIVMVGERGPELAALPVGSRVMSHGDMRDQVRGGGGGGNITLNSPVTIHATVRNDMDVEKIARAVTKAQGRMLMDASTRRGLRPGLGK